MTAAANHPRRFSLAVETLDDAVKGPMGPSSGESPSSAPNQPRKAFLVDLSRSPHEKASSCASPRSPSSCASPLSLFKGYTDVSRRPQPRSSEEHSKPGLKKAHSFSDSHRYLDSFTGGSSQTPYDSPTGGHSRKYSICDLDDINQTINPRRSSMPEADTPRPTVEHQSSQSFTDLTKYNLQHQPLQSRQPLQKQSPHRRSSPPQLRSRNHHRKPSLSLQFQNPKHMDDSVEF